MRTLSFIFFLGVALVGLMSATCQPRELNPGRPIDIDTTDVPDPGGPERGLLTVRVTQVTDGGSPCSQATVKLFAKQEYALVGSPHLVAQITNADGYTTFEWDPGDYYIVSTWELAQVPYTSDTTDVKGYVPSQSGVRGPQLVQIVKGFEKNVVDPVDLRE